MKGEPVRMRIVMEAPPAGVLFSLQDADNTPLDARMSEGGDLAFDLELRCDLSGGTPNFLGPFARGTRTERFIYVAAGAPAGQTDTCWSRRAKLRLADITAVQIHDARDGGVLIARIPGRMKDGSPVCAAVQPPGGWTLSSGPGGGKPRSSDRRGRK